MLHLDELFEKYVEWKVLAPFLRKPTTPLHVKQIARLLAVVSAKNIRLRSAESWPMGLPWVGLRHDVVVSIIVYSKSLWNSFPVREMPLHRNIERALAFDLWRVRFKCKKK